MFIFDWAPVVMIAGIVLYGLHIAVVLTDRHKKWCNFCHKWRTRHHKIWNQRDGCRSNAIPLGEFYEEPYHHG